MLASLFPVSGAVTSAVVLWSDNFNCGREFEDQNGDPLTGGDVGDGAVYQIGYFDGLASGTDPASLGGALWDSFIAISGDGSLNSGLVTTMGDTDLGPAPDSFVFQKTTFDTTLGHALPPAYPSRLGIRFFNNTTVASSTHSIIVTAFESSWLLSAPGNAPFVPFDASLDLDAGDLAGTLLWQGTAFQTSIPLVSSGTVNWQDTDSDWSQAGSWDNSGGGSAPPGSADIANFGSDATITNQPNLNGSSQAVLGITIDNGGADYTFRDTGSGSLTIGATGTLSFSSGLDSSGSTWLIDVASSSNYDVVDVTMSSM